MDKYKEIKNDWNCDARCMLTSLLVWDFKNVKCLIFVIQSLHFSGPLALKNVK
jgi:hypothetical protein